MMNNKEVVQTLLKVGDVEITFTKKDGTERVLIATLDIPADKRPKGPAEDASEEDIAKYEATQSKLSSNENLLRVFDAEKQDWRSVIIDTIKSISLKTD